MIGTAEVLIDFITILTDAASNDGRFDNEYVISWKISVELS